MANTTANALIGSAIYRMQRGSSSGQSNIAALNIPIVSVVPSRTELFVLANRISVQLYNNANGVETLTMADATIQLTENSIYVAFSGSRDPTGSYRIDWEIKEWN